MSMVIKHIKKHGKKVMHHTKQRGQKVMHHTKHHATKLQKEARKHTTTAISAAFAFVIALVWRDAIRSTIDSTILKLGIPDTAYAFEFIMAGILTVVCVLGIIIVSRFSVKE